MADAKAWWVIASTEYNGTSQGAQTYNYFYGTQAQAIAFSKRVIQVSTANPVTGPFPTKAAAQAAVKAKKVNATAPTQSGQTSTSPDLSAVTAACAWSFPGVSTPVGQIGGFCVLTKTQVRAILGGLMIGAAGLVGFAGVAVLTVYGFSRTGAGKAVTQSAAAVAKAVPFAAV